jgi:heat shock protein HslJ
MNSFLKRRRGAVPKLTIAAAGLGVLVFGLGCFGGDGSEEIPVAGPEPVSQEAEDLWDRTFASTEITEDGKPRPLLPDTRLTVAFSRDGRRDTISWGAGCNSFFADLEVSNDRLTVDDRFGGTLIGCPPDLAAQDAWAGELLSSDPGWRIIGPEFTLASGTTQVLMTETKRTRPARLP